MITVIDSHTGGEPTRVVVAGAPDLKGATMTERREELRREHDWLRTAVVCEPRGSDVMVGALLCKPTDPRFDAGVIFFNNVGYLNMCGHGTIGVAVTLAHLGRAQPGQTLRLETPVGEVTAALGERNEVTIVNVPSHRKTKGLKLNVPGLGEVTGDVAWGGNWFFLMDDHGLRIHRDNVAQLSDYCRRVKRALAEQGITGDGGMEIDHLEMLAPAPEMGADSRNFVLCPGDAYDRSPCGTGTSAKLACLLEDGKLAEGAPWRQASIVGSVFVGRARRVNGQIIPEITGSAYVTGESKIILHPDDPFRHGIP